MIRKLILIAFAVVLTLTSASPTENTSSMVSKSTVTAFFERIKSSGINNEAFELGLNGFYRLKARGVVNNNFLTIADMSVSANEKRFYVIDVKQQKVLYHTLVAHGQESGEEYACKFSNIESSHQTSLGFYKISETYDGKHGLSIRLDGLEKSNNLARERAIVIHQADYVSREFIARNGRLGRSFGCPALPEENYEDIVNTIKDGSCLFIYYPDENYLENSDLAVKMV